MIGFLKHTLTIYVLVGMLARVYCQNTMRIETRVAGSLAVSGVMPKAALALRKWERAHEREQSEQENDHH
jgi:hypothetical protein